MRAIRPLTLALLALLCTFVPGALAQAPSGPPVNGAAPTIKGTPLDGKKLKATEGSWTGLKPLSFTYSWQSCNASGSECAAIPSASAKVYVLSSADVGHTLRVLVTAENSEGSITVTSAPSGKVAPSAPRKGKSPTISGSTRDGQVLSAVNGTWKGTQPLAFSYQWQACQHGPCSSIAGATGPTYRARTAQLGGKLRVLVTAKNAAGSATATSKKTSAISPGPPVALTPPTISGEPLVEQTLTAEPGTWAGTGPFTYSYQWRSCNLLGECEDIAGATGSSYTVGPLQVADNIEVSVTARNELGSATATSEQTNLIKGLLPSNTGLPSITGLLQDGGLLSALTGSWSGTEPLAFSYVWEACDSAGANCAPISGALGSTLGLLAGEVGMTVRVVVTATNSAGSATAASPATSLIAGLLPANLGLPSITGLLEDGGLLSGLKGSWSGTEPLNFSYAWELCNATGGNCEVLSGALGTTLSLIGADVGRTVRLLVTATNQAGSTTATSEPTSLIGALLPSNTGLPSITGLLQDGASLAGLVGSWAGTGPFSYSYQWQQCDSSGGACKDISGATSAALGLISSQVGSTVRLLVTATNAAGSTTVASQPTSLIGALLPANTGLPGIGGLLQDGSSLSALLGSWTGTGPLNYSYQWLQCDSSGGACKEILGASGPTLGLVTGLIGSTVRLVVTATNGAGSSSATSEPTSLVKALLPSNTALPSIVGSLVDGSALTGAKGSWSGSEPSFSYQWLLCNAAGASCKEVSGATGSTLGLLTSMIGGTARLVVTATNSAGSTSATSAPTGLITALLPSNTSLPSVAGTLIDGSALTGAVGSWSGSAPSFSYQWLLCNAAGASCKEVSGATGGSLGLLTGMIGSTVRLVVTATNSAGSTSATSAPTGLITALLPSNTALPSIAGSLIDGSALTGAVGSWSGSAPSFSYQWLLCNAAGASCKEVSGATGSTLGLLTSMIGGTARLVVTATNSAGSTSATSAPTGLITALLPSNTALPSIAGSLIDGSALTGAKGSWSGSAPSFSYQWLLCNAAGASCKEVSGATGSTLGLLTSMIGGTARLVVTATNSAGATSATSEPTGLITALLPSNTSLPSVAGTLVDGSALTGAVGSWSGSAPSFSYQWLLCNSSGASCKEVSGATGGSLGLLTGMIGSTVRLVVTATNSAGSTSATSAPTGLITALLPSNTALPSVAGSLVDGSALTGAKGSWSGSEPSFSYQWLLCNAAGASCKEVSGATGSTLGLLTSMIGGTARLVVTATNSAGSTSATSAPTGLITALLPSNTALPSVAGSLVDGSALTGAKGSWSGSEPSFSYQWLLCNAAGASCKEVSGATGGSLGLLTGMIGSTVRLVVTATNSAGSTSATSAPTGLITALLPSNTALPSIAGSLVDGSSLTGAKGSWSGSEPSFSYQWLLCNAAGASCKEVSGATGSTLGLLTSMIGGTARLVVTATNSAGSTSATSEPTGLIKALLPSNTSLPSIAGLAEDGSSLTGAKGSWAGSEPTFSYQWLLCNAAGGECNPVSGATGTTLGLLTSEIGKTARLAVTATNSAGATTATSAPTSSILAILPANTVIPSIQGLLQVGQVLTAVNGKWSGSEPITYSYQWQTCGLGKESECKNLAEAVKSTLKLELSQVLGLTLRLIVTATNARGAVSKASTITTAVLGLVLSPVQGSTAGGTAVKLNAPEVSKATAVHFGAAKATEIEVDSPNEITAVTPPGTEGQVPVTVTTPEGTTHKNAEDMFTYQP